MADAARVDGTRWLAGVALLISLGLIVPHMEFYRHAGPLWRDEVNSVNVATMPGLRASFASMHYDSFSYAWVVLLRSWIGLFGSADRALRALGLLIGIGGIGVVWLSARSLGLAAPLASLVLFSLNPSTIVYGGSVRGYGLGALAVALSFGAVWSFVSAPRRASFLRAAPACMFASLTYLPNAVLLAAFFGAGGVVLLGRRDWRGIAGLAGLAALALFAWLLNLPWVAYAFRVAALEQQDVELARLLAIFRQALASDVALLGWCWAAAALLASAAGAVALRSRAVGERDRVLFAGLTVVAAAFGYFVYLRFGARLPTQFWYYLSLMVALALGFDALIDAAVRRWRGAQVAAAALALAAALGMAREVGATVRVRMSNLDLVAAHLEREARRGDLVVVFPWYCGITFQRYYRGAAEWITLPDFREHKFHTHLLVAERMKRGEDGVRAELERVERTLRAGGSVWVVGPLRAPAPGERLEPLPPAPGPQGWRAGPYLDRWELRLGELLRAHGAEAWKVPVDEPGPVNSWERLPLVLVQGWR